MAMTTPELGRSTRLDPGDAESFCLDVGSSAFFASGRPIAVSRAPGRLDILGGISDYSGGLVLELPLRVAALAASQQADDGRVVAVSAGRRIAADADALAHASLDELAATFTGEDAWGAYVLGPVALLARERGLSLPGLRVLISSQVPEAKGLGSSAAVEIAVLRAVAACLGAACGSRELALLAQRAEHIFAGSPCGVMDQMTVMHGEENELLALLCRPAEVVASVPLPRTIAAWAIDSGLPHAVSGAAYRRVRCAAFMGHALLGYGAGYLAELERDDVNVRLLPQRMLGADFLQLRVGITDPVSAVEPAVEYGVRAATLFPLEEQARAREFLARLGETPDDEAFRRIGELMYESHAGYSLCGLGAPRTDEIVEVVRAAGLREGLAGARVSGGGSGGAVVVLGRPEAEPCVRAIAESLGADLVGGSSPGAGRFGVRIVHPRAEDLRLADDANVAAGFP